MIVISRVSRMRTLGRYFVLIAALACALCAPAYAQARYSKLFVFGDSLTDSGNAFFLTAGAIPAAPYVEGRFSNGNNFADDLNVRLFGQPLVPSLDGGTNFAVGGATTGTANNAAPVPTGLLIQKNTFLQTFGRTAADADALYLVYGGSNDLFAAIDDVEHNRKDPAAAEADTIRDAMANLGKIIGDLSDRGARHFLVPNLGDLGKLPSLLNTPLSSFASQASAHFNDALERLLAGFSGLDIRRLDIHAAFDDARAGVGGFSDTTTSCYDGGTTGGPPPPCTDPADHLFWDGIHPTSRAHALLADRAFDAVVVPEPQTWIALLVGIAIVWAGLRGGRRSPRSNSSPSWPAVRYRLGSDPRGCPGPGLPLRL